MGRPGVRAGLVHSGDLHPPWGPAPPPGTCTPVPAARSPLSPRCGAGEQGRGWALTALVLIRAVAAVADEVAELLSHAAATVDNQGLSREDSPGYRRDNEAENPARIWAWCPRQVTEGTCGLQVTFVWSSWFGTLLGGVLSSQWHCPFDRIPCIALASHTSQSHRLYPAQVLAAPALTDSRQSHLTFASRAQRRVLLGWLCPDPPEQCSPLRWGKQRLPWDPTPGRDKWSSQHCPFPPHSTTPA